jgi:hypothetical protein
VWEESKKLWVIVAPAIFSRVVTFSMNVITQAFAGHIGDLELAAISIANTVVVGFNFGLMVRTHVNFGLIPVLPPHWFVGTVGPLRSDVLGLLPLGPGGDRPDRRSSSRYGF